MSILKAKLIDEVIRIEGGMVWVNDPADSGGETMAGITEKSAREWGYLGKMRNLDRRCVEAIYEDRYWHPLKLDVIQNFSFALAEELFDTGVNCGPATATFWLQRCLNVLNDGEKNWKDIKVDGDLGGKTLDALNSYFRVRKDPTCLLRMLNCLQGAFYIELAERRVKDERFVYGWIMNRVNVKTLA